MASAVRHRAAAAATRLLQCYTRCSPASHHLLEGASSEAYRTAHGSPFLPGQSFRNCSRSTVVGLLLDGRGRGLGETGQEGSRRPGDSDAGKCWDHQDRRQLSTNTSKASESDGEIYSSELLGFATSQRKDGELACSLSLGVHVISDYEKPAQERVCLNFLEPFCLVDSVITSLFNQKHFI